MRLNKFMLVVAVVTLLSTAHAEPLPADVVDAVVFKRSAGSRDLALDELKAQLDGLRIVTNEVFALRDKKSRRSNDEQSLLLTKERIIEAGAGQLRTSAAAVLDKLSKNTKIGAIHDGQPGYAIENGVTFKRLLGKLQADLDKFALASNETVKVRLLSDVSGDLKTILKDLPEVARPVQSLTPTFTLMPSLPPRVATTVRSGEASVPPAYYYALRAPGNVVAVVDGTIYDSQPPTTVAPDAGACNYVDPADLAATTEVEFTPEIRQLAGRLNYSPEKILEYVTNEIAFEPYYGSMKGAVGTLRAKAGNSTDNASLLIALLRASKVPARYVKGEISFRNDPRVNDWLGVKNYGAAQSILGTIPSKLILDTVSHAGVGIQMYHVWVEACLPYTAYGRSASGAVGGYRWVPLDASFKETTVTDKTGGDTTISDAFLLSLLKTYDNGLPAEKYLAAVASSLASSATPNLGTADLGVRKRIEKQKLDVIAPGLPYNVERFIGWNGDQTPSDIAAVPSRHKYKFSVNSEFFRAEYDLSSVASKRMTLSFLSSDGTNYSPVFKLDGVSQPLSGGTISTATAGLLTKLNLMVTLQDVVLDGNRTDVTCKSSTWGSGASVVTITPDASCVNGAVYDNIKTGSYHALTAFNASLSDAFLKAKGKTLIDSVRTGTTNKNDDTLGEFLHLALLKYMFLNDESAGITAPVNRMYARQGNSIGITSSDTNVQNLAGLPYSITAGALFIDVKGAQFTLHSIDRGIEYDSTNPDGSFNVADKGKGLHWSTFRLLAYAASANEHYIWQSLARLDAVSTVRGMQYAAAKQSASFVTLTAGNIGNWSTLMDRSMDRYKASILGATANGDTVTVPKVELAYVAASGEKWTGGIFLAENKGKGTVSAIISPNFGGGHAFTQPASVNYSATNNTGYLNAIIPNSSIPDAGYKAAITQVGSGNGTGITKLTTLAGDPVNMVTGNMYHSERDLVIKEPGLPLVFERNYNNRRPVDGPLGYGWTHSFNHRLDFKDEDATGGSLDNLVSTVVWVDGTGAEIRFSISKDTNGNYTFAAPTGFNLRLVASVSNNTLQFTLSDLSGVYYAFDNTASGAAMTVGGYARLEKVLDPSSNYLDLVYGNGSAPNRLTSILDKFGRSVTLGYNAATRIESIADWAGNVYKYSYDSNGNLSEFYTPLASSGKSQPTLYTYYTVAAGTNLDHAMESYFAPNGKGMTFEYYLDGRVFRHFDTQGNTYSFAYNDFRRESTTVNERGFKRTYLFNERGRPVTITDERGGATNYAYEDTANPTLMTKETGPTGLVTSYSYDSSGRMLKTTYPSLATVEYSDYLSNTYVTNKPGKVKDPNGNYTLYQFDAHGNVTDVIALKAGKGGAIVPSTYTPVAADIASWTKFTVGASDGLVNGKTDISNYATLKGRSFTYNYNDTVNGVNGLNVVSVTRCGDKNGDGDYTNDTCDVVNMSYDSLGRTLGGVNANSYPISSKYDSNGRVYFATDAAGNSYDLKYDFNGNLLQRTLSQPSAEFDSASDDTRTTYDQLDRVIASKDAAGATTSFEYDEAGNVIRVTNPDGYSIGYGYDQLNNRIMSYDDDGKTETRFLDGLGHPIKAVDGLGRTVEFAYYDGTQNGRAKSVTSMAHAYGWARVIEYGYDKNGNVTRVLDKGRGADATDDRETLTSYDELNRPVRVVGPIVTIFGVTGTVRPITKYVYSNLGYRTETWAGYTTDVTGASTASDVLTKQLSVVYDDFGRKLSETDQLGSKWSVTEYDIYNNAKTLSDAKGQVAKYEYYTGGDVKTRKIYANATAITPLHTTTYKRNALGQPTTLTAPEVAFTYTYDAAHRVQTVADGRGAKRLTFGWSAGGLLNYRDDGESKRENYLYDNTGRLTGIWAANGDIVSYLYDEAGRVREKWYPNGANTIFSYNPDSSISDITNKTYGGVTISADNVGSNYDNFGNRLSANQFLNTIGSRIYKYSYNALDQIYQVKDNSNVILQSFVFDQYGNRKTWTVGSSTKFYEYDSAHQLKNVRDGSATGAVLTSLGYDNNGNMLTKTEGVNTLTLTYDALDRLTQASKPGMSTEIYAYDPLGRRISTTVGTAITHFLYNGPDIIAEYGSAWGNPTAKYAHGPFMDDPLLRTATETHYYHQDSIGSVAAMTNAAGTLTMTRRYDMSGNVEATNNYGPMERFGFAGREHDGSGLIYMRARSYDPTVGRFTQRDPLGFIDGVNRYVYAINNPINYNDPWGMNANAMATAFKQAGYASMSHDAAPASVSYDFSTAHTVLGAVGSFPTPNPVSAVANGLDSAIYVGERNYVEAGVAALGIIGGGGAKMGVKAAMNVEMVAKGLPNKADDLLKQGYKDVSHPDAAKAGHRTFENPSSGDKVRFDQGKTGQPGYEGQDHYHRYNPNATGKQDMYLDKNGNPCARGCDASHLFPGD